MTDSLVCDSDINEESSRTQQNTLKCAIITPVGPGHEPLYQQCIESAARAYAHSKGYFTDIVSIKIDDSEGKLGRSQGRNMGVKQAAEQGIDWLFFLDADDLVAPNAFEVAAPYMERYDAIWGQIYSFVQGDTEAIKRPNQLECTESLEDILNCDPALTLQMGHFVKTAVALNNPFDESMDTGEDFDYYLRLWDRYICIKIPNPLFFNRRGVHSKGSRSADGRQWRKTVESLLNECRNDKKHHNQRSESNRSTNGDSNLSKMDIAIYGMMRSGTTLLSDLLSIKRRSLILNEPNIHLNDWGKHTLRQLQAYGLDIDERDWDPDSYESFQQFFDKKIQPMLRTIDLWGVKMVNFTNWQNLLELYKPRKLILCVRDIRDVVLSALDLAERLNSNKINQFHMDEAWIEKRAIETSRQLLHMTELPHMLVRYEDLCNDPGVMKQVCEYVGINDLGTERFGLNAVPHRLYEQEKHGVEISAKTVKRYLSEPPGAARELADRVWRQTADYARRFGYDEPESENSSYSTIENGAAAHVNNQHVKVDDARSDSSQQKLGTNYTEFWRQDNLANIIPQNRKFGEYPEGWDVPAYLSRIISPYIRSRIVEIGCGYGRLCHAFAPKQYLGLDINEGAVDVARKKNPVYHFEHVAYVDDYPQADICLAYTVLLHLDDVYVKEMIARLCHAAPVVVVAEILGRQRWRRSGNPPVFNRDLEDYIALFAEKGFALEQDLRQPYHHYSDTDISFLFFRSQMENNRESSHGQEELSLLSKILVNGNHVLCVGAIEKPLACAVKQLVGEQGEVYQFDIEKSIASAVSCKNKDVVQQETIRANSIDDLRLSKCDLIMLYGKEQVSAWIQGATATIGQRRPFIYLDTRGSADINEFVSALEQLGYEVFRVGISDAANSDKINTERLRIMATPVV